MLIHEYHGPSSLRPPRRGEKSVHSKIERGPWSMQHGVACEVLGQGVPFVADEAVLDRTASNAGRLATASSSVSPACSTAAVGVMLTIRSTGSLGFNGASKRSSIANSALV